MKTYMLIVNTKREMKGVPIFMNAALHENFYADGSRRPMPYDWVCEISTIPSRGTPLSFPEELWLISRDKRYSFDVHFAHTGMIVSKDFMELLPSSDLDNFKIAKLHVVNSKKENIAAKEMFFMKFKLVINAVDRKKSKFIQEMTQKRLLYTRDSEPSIGYVRELHIDPAKVDDMNIFISSDLSVVNAFASTELCDTMRSHGIVGLDYIELENYAPVQDYMIRELEREYGKKLDEIPNVQET